jgi:hypothetical protein
MHVGVSYTADVKLTSWVSCLDPPRLDEPFEKKLAARENFVGLGEA